MQKKSPRPLFEETFVQLAQLWRLPDRRPQSRQRVCAKLLILNKSPPYRLGDAEAKQGGAGRKVTHEEFKRRIKTQTVRPSAEAAAMLFWALLASGQINMRKVDGWQTLATKPIDQPIDLAA